MKTIILLIIALVGFATLHSCTYDWYEPIEPDIPDVVSYSVNIQPIWDDGCNDSGCHAAGGTSPDLTKENSYNSLWSNGLINTTDPYNSKIYTKCAPNGSMNKYTEPGDYQMILAWLEQGAKNN